MALETGMRRGEILSLRWSDVDMKAGMLYIGKTKNNEARHVPMSNRLRATLAALPRRLRNEHVFTGSILTTPAAGKRRRPLNQSIGKVGKPPARRRESPDSGSMIFGTRRHRT
jgi:integrase